MRTSWMLGAVASATLAVSLMVVPPAHAGDPTSNTRPGGLQQSCAMYSAAAYVSNECVNGALADINAARSKEGLGRMLLPSNFRNLSVAQQLFVLADIERVDRGLWPFVGESSRLNSVGAQSAAMGIDVLPCSNCYAAANWSVTRNAFWSHFLWMYDDGPDSPNSAGDWGHRHNILINTFPGPLLMGAGTGAHGTGQVIQGRDTSDRSDVITWASESAYFTPIHTPTLHVSLVNDALVVQLKGQSHSFVKLQAKHGNGWWTVANYVTPGTSAVAAIWNKRLTPSHGTYRVVALRNTRYTRVISGAVTVH